MVRISLVIVPAGNKAKHLSSVSSLWEIMAMKSCFIDELRSLKNETTVKKEAVL